MRKLISFLVIVFIGFFSLSLAANAPVAAPVDGLQENIMPFTVYPNPLTVNKLIINLGFDQPVGDVVFSINNVLGQQIFTYTVAAKDFTNGSFTVDFSNINMDKGIYLMKMSHGHKSSVQKLVVK